MSDNQRVAMNWIKVEDELPKEGQEVYYFFEVLGVFGGIYRKIEYPKEFTGSDGPIYGNQFGGSHGFLTDDVTHWMPYKDGDPLPDPPVIEDSINQFFLDPLTVNDIIDYKPDDLPDDDLYMSGYHDELCEIMDKE